MRALEGKLRPIKHKPGQAGISYMPGGSSCNALIEITLMRGNSKKEEKNV